MRLKLFKKTYVTLSSNMLGRKNEVIIPTARYFISHNCYQETGRKDTFWKKEKGVDAKEEEMENHGVSLR